MLLGCKFRVLGLRFREAMAELSVARLHVAELPVASDHMPKYMREKCETCVICERPSTLTTGVRRARVLSTENESPLNRE